MRPENEKLMRFRMRHERSMPPVPKGREAVVSSGMKERIVIALVCLLAGGFAGSWVARYSAHRHQHALSVMWLAQFHLQRLATAADARQCPIVNEERDRLAQLQVELRQAFPLAYRQDADFRTRADALESAEHPVQPLGNDCAAAVNQVHAIKDACDGCHRLYR